MLRRFLKISLMFMAFGPSMAFAKAPSLPCLGQESESSQAATLMGSLMSFPTIPYMIGDKDGMAAFVPTSEVFAAVIGTPKAATVINHVEELRFLPNVLAKGAVLLVLNSADGFEAADAAKAAAVAAELEIKVSLVWLAEPDVAMPETVLKLVKETRGVAVDREELVRKSFAYACPADQ